MIRVINITTDTRLGDAYDSVAVNRFPIVLIEPDEDVDIYKDEDFIKVISGHIKNSTVYHKAKLYIRIITDDYEAREEVVKLDKVIHLDDWD